MYKALFLCFFVMLLRTPHASQAKIVSYTADPAKQDIRLYWKNDSGAILGDIGKLKSYLAGKGKELVFAMNGGMFKPDFSPVGLFVVRGQPVSPLDTASGVGNFYLKPNGVFYIDSARVAGICATAEFSSARGVRYATQSGPMLLIHGQIHPAFKESSANINIHNGVGLLPGNRLLFAMATTPVNFYDFAKYFKDQGCSDALYLDGFISRAFIPGEGLQQMDGHLGVMIGIDE